MDPNEIARFCESLSIQSKEEKLWGVIDSLKVAAGKKLDLMYFINRTANIACSQLPLVVALGTKNNIVGSKLCFSS